MTLLSKLSILLDALKALDINSPKDSTLFPYGAEKEWWDFVFQSDINNHRVVGVNDMKEKYEKVFLTKRELKIIKKLRRETLLELNEVKSLSTEIPAANIVISPKIAKVMLTASLNEKNSEFLLRKVASEKLLMGHICIFNTPERMAFCILEGRESSCNHFLKFVNKRFDKHVSTSSRINRISPKRLFFKTYDNINDIMHTFTCLEELQMVDLIRQNY